MKLRRWRVLAALVCGLFTLQCGFAGSLNLGELSGTIVDTTTGIGVQGTVTIYPVGSINEETGALIGTPTASTIYQDQDGDTATANPFTSEADGDFRRFVAPGAYDLFYTGSTFDDYWECGVQVPSAINSSGISAFGKGLDGIGLIANNFAGDDIGAKVNAALLAAGATFGATIYIKEGTYAYTTPIVVTRSRVKIIGAGPQSTLLRYQGASGSAMVVGQAGDYQSTYVEIAGLTLKTEDQAVPKANEDPILLIINAKHCYFHDMGVQSSSDTENLAQDCIRITSDNGNDDSADGCYANFFNNLVVSGPARHAICITTESDGQANSFANANEFINLHIFLYRAGATGKRAIYVGAGAADGVCRANNFYNCYVDTDNGDPAVDAGGLEFGGYESTYNRFEGALDGYQTGEMVTLGANSTGCVVRCLHVDGNVSDAGTDNTLDVGWAANVAAGIYSVPWATTFGDTVDVTGAVDLSSTLDVTGATTLSSTLDVTGATDLASTLDVTGATTLDSTLDVAGATTCGDTLLTSGTFRAVGAATLDSTLSVGGTVTLESNNTITNAAAGAVAISGVLSANLKFATIVANTDASETLTAAQSGALVTCSNASGTTTITLPDPGATTVGVTYTILQTADQNVDIVPTTADGDSIIADNVATSDKVSLSTASHKVGAGAVVYGISATKWLIVPLSPTCPLTVEAAD